MTTRLILSSRSFVVGIAVLASSQRTRWKLILWQIFSVVNAILMAQERFWRHQHQRFAEAAVQLAAQNMEIVGRRGAVGDDPVVLRAHLQETLKPGRAECSGP